MTAEELFFPAIQDIFDDGKGWVITPNPQILTMHILEAQPRIHNEEQKNLRLERQIRHPSRS